MSSDTKYNGWTNYETWLCNLWFDDFSEEATEIVESFGDEIPGEDDKVGLTNDLADRIREFVEEFQPEMPEASFYTDIMNAAIREVNFFEIAEHYIDDAISEVKASRE